MFHKTLINTPESKYRLEKLMKVIPSNSDPNIICNLVKGLYELDKSKFYNI
jgi:hypothetical protein